MTAIKNLEIQLQVDVQDALRDLIEMEGASEVFLPGSTEMIQGWAEDSIRDFVARGGGRPVVGIAFHAAGRLVVADRSGRDLDLGNVAAEDLDAALEAVGLRRFHDWTDGKVAVTAEGPWSA